MDLRKRGGNAQPEVPIQSIEEGYRYSGEGDRAVLTPMWALTTDQGTFLLDCASGALTPME